MIMFWQIIFFISSSYAFQQMLQGASCITIGNSRTIRVSLNRTMGPTGLWLDSLSAWTESNSSEASAVDIAHTITESQGKRITLIQLLSLAPRYDESHERLMFHPRSGKNIALSNNGHTVERINPGDQFNAAVFTNRPLKEEEMFEVKIERRNNDFVWSPGIGIMTKSALDVDILSEIWKSPVVWMYYDRNIYSNGQKIVIYHARNLEGLQIGDTIGVMRNKTGTLHFFVNGQDQGPAISDVPPNVYGVLDLRGITDKASIVHR